MNSSGFRSLFLLTQAVGLAAVVMVATWTVVFRGGFAWSRNPELQFNWHPLLSTVGMIYLFANSILAFRILQNLRNKSLKLIHAISLLAVVVLASAGLAAVIDSHNRREPPVANFYSIHSWMGIVTVSIFILQWLLGFLAFLYPGFSSSLRKSILPVHTFIGLTSFVFAIATALTGIKAKAKLSTASPSKSDGETYLINATGITLMVFGTLVIYLATKRETRRDEFKLNNSSYTA